MSSSPMTFRQAAGGSVRVVGEIFNNPDLTGVGKNYAEGKKLPDKWKRDLALNSAMYAGSLAAANYFVPGLGPALMIGADLSYSGYRGLRHISKTTDAYSKNNGKNDVLRVLAKGSSVTTGIAASVVGTPDAIGLSALNVIGQAILGNNEFIDKVSKLSKDGSEAGGIGKAAFKIVDGLDWLGKRGNPPESTAIKEARSKKEAGK